MDYFAASCWKISTVGHSPTVAGVIDAAAMWGWRQTHVSTVICFRISYIFLH
jgi:hypothetical protein